MQKWDSSTTSADIFRYQGLDNEKSFSPHTEARRCFFSDAGGGTRRPRRQVLFDLEDSITKSLSCPTQKHAGASSPMPEVGLEPTPLTGHDFESCAAAITPLRQYDDYTEPSHESLSRSAPKCSRPRLAVASDIAPALRRSSRQAVVSNRSRLTPCGTRF